MIDTSMSVPGYKTFKGQVLNANDLDQLIDGLRSNELLSYDYLLTGK